MKRIDYLLYSMTLLILVLLVSFFVALTKDSYELKEQHKSNYDSITAKPFYNDLPRHLKIDMERIHTRIDFHYFRMDNALIYSLGLALVLSIAIIARLILSFVKKKISEEAPR